MILGSALSEALLPNDLTYSQRSHDMSSITVDSLKFNNTPMQTSSSEQATKADIIELRKDMAEMKSELFKAMMLQVFAIGGLVVAVIKFMQP